MWLENVGTFIDFGFQHIIPQGLDHVLFVVALYLNARSLSSLLIQVTTFTVAHTITLGLAATGGSTNHAIHLVAIARAKPDTVSFATSGAGSITGSSAVMNSILRSMPSL